MRRMTKSNPTQCCVVRNVLSVRNTPFEKTLDTNITSGKRLPRRVLIVFWHPNFCAPCFTIVSKCVQRIFMPMRPFNQSTVRDSSRPCVRNERFRELYFYYKISFCSAILILAGHFILVFSFRKTARTPDHRTSFLLLFSRGRDRAFASV